MGTGGSNAGCCCHQNADGDQERLQAGQDKQEIVPTEAPGKKSPVFALWSPKGAHKDSAKDAAAKQTPPTELPAEPSGLMALWSPKAPAEKPAEKPAEPRGLLATMVGKPPAQQTASAPADDQAGMFAQGAGVITAMGQAAADGVAALKASVNGVDAAPDPIPKKAKLELLNLDLAKEYLATCGEYFKLLQQPHSPLGPRELLSCQPHDWESTFRQWGAIQFFFSIFTNVVMFIIFAASGIAFSYFVQSFITNLIVSYLVAHLTWFGVLKKRGCCWCFIICCISDAPILLLIWGCLAICWAAWTCLNSWLLVGPIFGIFAYASWFSLWGILVVFFYCVHGMMICHMGVAAIRIWQTMGSPVPEDVEVTVMGKPLQKR